MPEPLPPPLSRSALQRLRAARADDPVVTMLAVEIDRLQALIDDVELTMSPQAASV